MLRLVRDYRPLFLFGGAGVILVMSGVVLGLNSFYEWLEFGYITHPPLVVLFSLMILSGVQLLSFGLIADMIKSLRRDFRRNIS
jgi:dolichol-phosphate mannosyltransferase